MAEEYRTDDEALALSGTTGGGGVPHGTANENPNTTSQLRKESRLYDAMIPLTALEVYKDGDLTYGVRAGQFVNVDAVVSYTASTGNALTNNATNYIFLVRAGTLTINTTGFPTPGVTPHIALAEIVTASGNYSIDDGDITDRRTRSLFTLVGIQAWEDMQVPLTAGKPGAANDPTWTSWLDDGAGSEGLAAWFFSDQAVQGNEEQLFFTAQLPHNYKEGSDIEAHLHWAAEANGAAGQVVSWGLEYAIKSRGGIFGNTTIISGNTHVPDDDPLVADTHYVTGIGDISGTGITVSAIIMGRIFRDSSGTLKTDDYTDDGIALEIDFHYEVDSHGSQSEDDKL